ncbi:MAG: ceramidase domain-containing protein [Bacteroidota bacterium]
MNQYITINQLISPADNGPVYRETVHLSELIVEPWNAYSSLTFILVAIILLWQLRGNRKDFPFIVFFCVPLLIFGGLGSTLFHAFRSSVWLLLMDVLPIILLVLGVSIWMWLKVLSPKWLVIPVVVIFVGLTYFSRLLFDGQDQISAGYVVRGTMLLLPCFLYLTKTEFRLGRLLAAAAGCFALALTFRYLDEKIELEWMSWGTHWLWHVSTAVGAYFLGRYLIGNTEKATNS